jgi:hypothetical protein
MAFVATTPIHELGHALFLTYSGATIMEIQWFNFDLLQKNPLQASDNAFMLGRVVHDSTSVQIEDPMMRDIFNYGRKLSGGLLVFIIGLYAKIIGWNKTGAAMICAGAGGMTSDLLDSWMGSPDLLLISGVAILTCILICDRPMGELFEDG